MKRPADQAKLLFLYLLRSSAAALATTQAGGGTSKALLLPHHEGHICLRLARRNDVVPIQRCNFATLPENYNANFYDRHLRKYPDLALVAEHVVSPEEGEGHSSTRRFHNPAFPGLNSHCEGKIVGYVLGKVEEPPRTNLNNNGMMNENTNWPSTPGHVISLAVLHDYRRHGLAAALMDQLHLHLEQAYGASSVGLHVRKSNEAAWKLYERDGYVVHNVISRYYEDGEDAYYMQKPLRPTVDSSSSSSSSMVKNQNNKKRGWGGRPRPWENGPLEFRLPRNQAFRDSASTPLEKQQSDADDSVTQPHHEQHIITGTM